MTRQEAIETIKIAISQVEWEYPMDYAVAFDMAVEALSQPEIVRCKDCAFHDSGENEVDAWNRCKLHKINTSDNEYCSWGAIRE